MGALHWPALLRKQGAVSQNVVTFDFLWSDWDATFMPGDPTGEPPEEPDFEDDDPFAVVDWGPDDEELEADQSEALAA